MLIGEADILAMLLCLLLTAIGFKARSWPINIIAAFGWIIEAMRLYAVYSDLLIMGLMLMAAFVTVLATPSKSRKG